MAIPIDYEDLSREEIIYQTHQQNKYIIEKLQRFDAMERKLDNMGNKLKLALGAMKILKEEVQGIQKSQSYLSDKFENQTRELKNIQNKLKTLMTENKVRDQQLDQYKERLRKYEDKLKLNQNQINRFGDSMVFICLYC